MPKASRPIKNKWALRPIDLGCLSQRAKCPMLSGQVIDSKPVQAKNLRTIQTIKDRLIKSKHNGNKILSLNNPSQNGGDILEKGKTRDNMTCISNKLLIIIIIIKKKRNSINSRNTLV